MNLQLHCARHALSQHCKIFKGLQRDEKIAKFTSTYNKKEQMATNKRRKAETVKRNSKEIKTNKSEKDQITHFYNYLKRTACINTPHAPLPPLHNLQKTQCNAISAETVATETVKQQSHTRQVHSKKFFKQKRHGYRAFWCDFQKNCQADKNRVVTVCPVT